MYINSFANGNYKAIIYIIQCLCKVGFSTRPVKTVSANMGAVLKQTKEYWDQPVRGCWRRGEALNGKGGEELNGGKVCHCPSESLRKQHRNGNYWETRWEVTLHPVKEKNSDIYSIGTYYIDQ